MTTHDRRPIRHGKALTTTTGFVLYRPRVLPQDRWLVSSSEDGIYHRVYRRASWLRRLVTGKRWRRVSGAARFLDAYDAWKWVEQACVNRVTANDWHGVGYARWMQSQTYVAPPHRAHLPPPSWLGCYTTEPLWVYQFYRDGPPNWDSVGE